MKRYVAVLIGLNGLLRCSLALAQTIPVGLPAFDDLYRRNQLRGKVDSTVSFTVRPLSAPALGQPDPFFPDTLSRYYGASKVSQILLLPISWQQQYSSHHPSGFNDGAMIPAKGYQTLLSAGAFLKYGPLTVTLRPEFVFAENKNFKEFRSYYGPADIPERFGTGSYSAFSWGQSSVRLNLDPVSIGISNENLWWGPGIKNSLLMSNNAPGFKHLSLNTTRPVRIGIGSLEGQIIAARLEGSGITPNLPDDWRYLSAMVMSFNPKWVPGLFVGLTRSFQQYSKQDRSFGDYFPLFQPFQKVNTNEDEKERDQLTSIFARWLFTRANAEIYMEYGLNDHSYNIRDFLMSPEHSRAYTVGFRKLVMLDKLRDDQLQIGFELTHMSQSLDRVVRDAGEWYTHSQVLHGYTNKGQVLGAGVGPGGNFQAVDVSWFRGFKQIGLQLERFEHNADYGNVLGRGKWVDFGIAAASAWDYDNFIFNAKLQGVQSVNYQWNSGAKGYPKQNVFNVIFQLGTTYRFKNHKHN